MITKEFMLAGNATFTLELNQEFQQKLNRAHYTFRVTCSESEKWGKTYFVGLLTGPDNESDYTYLGLIANDMLKLTQKSRFSSETPVVKLCNRLINRIMKDETQAVIDAGFGLHHEGKCGRCGRTLTTPESVSIGIGPECLKRMEA